MAEKGSKSSPLEDVIINNNAGVNQLYFAAYNGIGEFISPYLRRGIAQQSNLICCCQRSATLKTANEADPYFQRVIRSPAHVKVNANTFGGCLSCILQNNGKLRQCRDTDTGYGQIGYHDVSPQVSLCGVLSNGDVTSCSIGRSLGLQQGFTCLICASNRAPSVSSVFSASRFVGPSRQTKPVLPLAYSEDEANDRQCAEDRASDLPIRRATGFMRCFLSSYGGAPLGAQISGVVLLSMVAGVGVIVG